MFMFQFDIFPASATKIQKYLLWTWAKKIIYRPTDPLNFSTVGLRQTNNFLRTASSGVYLQDLGCCCKNWTELIFICRWSCNVPVTNIMFFEPFNTFFFIIWDSFHTLYNYFNDKRRCSWRIASCLLLLQYPLLKFVPTSFFSSTQTARYETP